jgi:hypothetical protein
MINGCAVYNGRAHQPRLAKKCPVRTGITPFCPQPAQIKKIDFDYFSLAKRQFDIILPR